MVTLTHLVAIFGKREKSDLSRTERQAVAALVRQCRAYVKNLRNVHATLHAVGSR